MKKSFKYYAIIWAILFALFNAVAFLSPGWTGIEKYTGSFWVGYVFIVIAFVGQLVCANIAFKAENLQKLFYNIPLISISYGGLVAMLVFGVLAMLISPMPYWIGAIICVIILAFTAISVVKASAAAEAVSDIDKKIKTKTYFIKSLTAEAESLMAEAGTPEIKAQAKRVYEAFRYSDPMSNAALVETEEQLEREFNSFADAVRKGDVELAESIASELLIIVDRRNKKCKLLK